MASLNTSTNGPAITNSYQKIVNSPPPSGAAASSPTYGQWAVFVVQAPLVSAFQGGAGKESVLKVQTTGEGELSDLIDEFSDGRIQFAFVKVKDPNSTLPKNILIAWCGEGVPERTKGYFGSHLEAVSKILHGYHVQVTARSDRDLTPESITQKVADASGAKYGGGISTSSQSNHAPPPIASKPVFQPTRVGGGSSGIGSPSARSRAPEASGPVDSDGWGEDAPEVTRSQLEKVGTAYQPTKVNISEIQRQSQPSRYVPPTRPEAPQADVTSGGYQPIGKVDIAAIRRQAQESGNAREERPTVVKGAYEPVGKVDIAAIRAKAQAPSSSNFNAPSSSNEHEEAPRSLADRSAGFQQSERMTSMPKPKVANRFGGQSSFTGTKAPTPSGFGGASIPSAAPVGTASKTFADEGGKTPAQIWAEKKARERGSSITSNNAPASISSQPSGSGFDSGYGGKKWAPVSINQTGRSAASNLDAQRTGDANEGSPVPSGGVNSIRDRFSGEAPPPMDLSSKPASRNVPMPGLSGQSNASEQREDEHVDIPPPPRVPRMPSPEPEEDDDGEYRSSSPARIVMPVSRTKQPELEPAEELHAPPPMPVASMAKAAREVPPPAEEPEDVDDGRGASEAVAKANFGAEAAAVIGGGNQGGKRALVQFDYEKAEDNEIELREGTYVTNLDMVHDEWWVGTNEHGETGLFPSNYVELVEDEAPEAAAGASHSAPSQSNTAPQKLPTAVAQYDYEAGEDNELSFPEGATITDIQFPDDDWWSGSYQGQEGLFPANYVQLNE